MLYTRGADVILSGHAHRYERHAPRNPDGQLDPTNGIRQFVVGTGGEPGGSEIDTTQVPNFQEPLDKVQVDTFGVIKLDLSADSYNWTFVPIAGQTFTDSGSGRCHGAPGSADSTPPTVTQVFPGENAANVSPSTTVKATFSEAMDASTTDGDPSTITATTFMLFRNGSTSQIAAKVSYDSSTRTAKLNPNNNLSRGVTYKAVLTPGVQDVAGNPLAQQKEWLFTVKR
jgi:hypothetical protein